MRITHFSKNTFSKHYLSMATYERILLQSGRNEKNLLEKQDESIKSKHFTPLNKQVTLPKMTFFDQSEIVSPMQRLRDLHSKERRVCTSTSGSRLKAKIE